MNGVKSSTEWNENPAIKRILNDEAKIAGCLRQMLCSHEKLVRFNIAIWDRQFLMLPKRRKKSSDTINLQLVMLVNGEKFKYESGSSRIEHKIGKKLIGCSNDRGGVQVILRCSSLLNLNLN